MFTKFHVVCIFVSVYAIFEKEDAKAHCVQALNAEDNWLATCIHGEVHRRRFRGIHCLDVEESSEQSNVLWQNAGVNNKERFFRKILSAIIVLGVLYCCFRLIKLAAVSKYSQYTLLLTITAMDNCLPIVMSTITLLEAAADEDDRQNTLMIKLFLSRIMTAVFFPFYVAVPWEETINSENIARIANLQLVSCFVSPFVKLFDPVGFVKRYIFTPLLAKTQAEANIFWSGTPFTLAERYTEVSKIMFVSLFYSVLIPSALFIGGIAFLNLFLIDRYLLLRKNARPPKLDNSMGPTVSKQLAFALFVKMIVSMMFVYGWPMDEVYREENGEFERANKEFPVLPLWRLRKKEWQTDTQWRAVRYYIIAVYVVAGFCVLIFLFDVLEKIIASFTLPSIECNNQTPFSSVDSIVTYCPVLRYGPESFLAADTRYMLPRHRPDTIDLFDAASDDGEFNLADYLSHKTVRRTMSIVKWYGGDDDSLNAANTNLNTESKEGMDVANVDLEFGDISMVSVKRSSVIRSDKQIMPVTAPSPETAVDRTYVPIVSFNSEERSLLKKVVHSY